MLLLIGGPSGSGKTTVANILQEKHGFSRLVTVTTRPPREGEKNGVDYYFVSIDEFRSMQSDGSLFESTQYAGHWYGTKRSSIMDALESPRYTVAIVDANGARQFKQLDPQKVRTIYLYAAPETLRKRMLARGESEETIQQRLAKLAEDEFRPEYREVFDFEIENREGHLGETIEKVLTACKVTSVL